MKNVILKLKRDLIYTKTLRALNAAFYYDSAIFLSKQTKPTSYRDAEAVSEFINQMWDEKTTPEEFLKPINQNIDSSLSYYDQYAIAVKEWPFDKQTLESFAKHYAWTGRKFAMLKCNVFYILFLGQVIEAPINQDYKEKFIDSIIVAGNRLFSFDKHLVLRSFIQAVNTFQSIDQKILFRKVKKLKIN